MNGWMDGYVDGQMDGWMDGQTVSVFVCLVVKCCLIALADQQPVKYNHMSSRCVTI